MAKDTPFSDITVLDFSRYLPGGYATQVLADLGATVIKVEDTGLGDFMRHDYPTKGGGISYYITALGRNKKSEHAGNERLSVCQPWFYFAAASL